MRLALLSVLVLTLCVVTMCADEDPVGKTLPKPKTACHGTTVEFVDTPVEAAKLASGQKRLVFVLHVSGHFEDPRFT
jgi:hypothetical protein